jgi:hypothetical protein
MESSDFTSKRKVRSMFCAVLLLISLSSCYSVRVVCKDGVPEPNPMNTSADFYKGKNVTVIDTTITLKLQQGEFYLIEKCAARGFFSFEYRVTFGGVLLNAVTLGKKRQVKVKYVCLKQTD